MFRLTTFVRSLGTRGALANVQAIFEAQVREEWLVEGLTRRLELKGLTAVQGQGVRTA